MKMVQVNGPALEAAIKAIGGEEGYRMVEHAYGVLDAYEAQVRKTVEFEREAVYKEGFDDGYECGRDVVLGGPQPTLAAIEACSLYNNLKTAGCAAVPPDVIYLPDLSHLGPHDDPSEPELPFE